MSNIPYGFCQCGCGQKTTISKRTNKANRCVKGEPRKYIQHHNPKGEKSWNWKGGKKNGSGGYVLVNFPEHPKADKTTGYVYEHILVAEKALGKYLPYKAIVHHVDGNKRNNHPSNLIICQDLPYHMLLHRRQKEIERSKNGLSK